jgi:dTDP-3-amino-3,6-dideoxy-alpha-D-glucopyranose N,N-dimethyltransferase/dTDP-3-amino-3,4,6-trideoxy-alpha-D-glucopyranose N,N-dimethyltransferase/N-methyltransferase
MYGKSAEIYDLLYVGAGIKNYPAEAAELHRIIEEACPSARTLLDVACGTGLHLVELQRWFDVEGVDASQSMLDVAARRLPGVPLNLGDMRTLHLGRRFDAVTCLFSSIGYVTDGSELQRTIERLGAHVAPGGVLIVDGWLRPEEWTDDYRGDPDIASDGETTVVRVSFSRREGRITELEMHHLVRTRTGIDYFAETHRLALAPTAEYVAAFKKAGLQAEVLPNFMPGRDRIMGTRPVS